MRTEDGYLVNKCLHEDPSAFGILVDKYKESVYALAFSKLGNFHDAQDITQDVFLKAYEKLHTLKQWDNFHAWIYAITANLCKTFFRARKLDNEYIAQQRQSLTQLSIAYHRETLTRELVYDALDALPENDRQVLSLHYLGGLKCKEIARFLGISPSAVEQRLCRARARLRNEVWEGVETTFRGAQLEPGFTIRIVEAVKRMPSPAKPHIKWLPIGISAVGLVAALMGAFPSQDAVLRVGHDLQAGPMGGVTPVAEDGEIPATSTQTSRIWVFSSQTEENGSIGKWVSKRLATSSLTWTVASTGTALADASVGGPGAWGDYDGDGDLDLFVGNSWNNPVEREGQADRLFRNDNGVFVDVASDTELAGNDAASKAVWVDYDDDGDLDLHVVNYESPSRLFRNDSGTFVDIAPGTPLAEYMPGASGAAWGDYDGDGDLDLFVSGNPKTGSRLLRNDGGEFRDVTGDSPLALAGVDAISPTWGDYDNDGDLDLYVSGRSGAGRHYLFRNDSGRFVDVTLTTIGPGKDYAYGAMWVDYDNDGDLDLYVNHGHQHLYDAYPNHLFRNDGNERFVDVAPMLGLDVTENTECVSWADYDNDGDLDVYMSDHVGRNHLFRNDGDQFTDITDQTPLGISGWNHAVIWGDYDNDGDLDLYAVVNGVNHLFENHTDNEGYLFVRPLSANGGLNCFGAQVRVYDVLTGKLMGMRSIDGGSGHYNQNAYDAHFGLDPHRWYDVEVAFVGGNKVIKRNVVPSDLPGQRLILMNTQFAQHHATGQLTADAKTGR